MALHVRRLTAGDRARPVGRPVNLRVARPVNLRVARLVARPVARLVARPVADGPRRDLYDRVP